MKANVDKYFFVLTLVLFLVVIDQISKYLIRANGGFYICNADLAFGIKIPGNIFYFFWIVIIFAIFRIAKRNLKLATNNPGLLFTKTFPLVLISSGAVSNIIDRLRFGCVVDFIDLKFWPVFNLADIFISIGAIMIIIRHRTQKI
jgi:signal peptidase II